MAVLLPIDKVKVLVNFLKNGKNILMIEYQFHLSYTKKMERPGAG